MKNLEEIEKNLKIQTKHELSDTFSLGSWFKEMWKTFKKLFGKSDIGEDAGTKSSMQKNQITIELEAYEKKLRGSRKIVKK